MKNIKISPVKLLIILFFIIAVIFPFLNLLINLDKEEFKVFFENEQSIAALINSLIVACVSTVIALFIAFILALCITRSNIRYKSIFTIILTLPMLIPSISHGMGLIVVLGKNGVITNLFNLNWNIYGFRGIVIGSVLYSFPIAFLMFMDSLKYENGLPYEAASVLGIPRLNQLIAIMLPYLKKPFISIAFATFTLVITDYGVPLIIGGQYTTLPVLMYQEVIGRLDFQKGSVIGSLLIVPAIIAFVLDIINKENANNSLSMSRFKVKINQKRDCFCYICCVLISTLILIPIIAFILLTFIAKYPIDLTLTLDNILQTFQMQGGKFLMNSLILSISVSTIGVVIAFIVAFITARVKSFTSKIIHLLSISSLAIPGIVLGLSYTIAFNESLIYGTWIILILVSVVHFFSSPYLLMYNALGKINPNIEFVASTLGINHFHVIKDVLLPQTKDTLLEMYSYFFVNCMMTISAVSFLANTDNKPISLLITQFEGQSKIESAAFISLLILGVNLLLKFIIFLLKKGIAKHAYRNAL